MRLLFIGSTLLGRACLEALMKIESVSVSGILTAPREFPISYAPNGVTNFLHCNFSDSAEQLRCPLILLQSNMTAPELFNTIESVKPDCLFVVGWHHMIPDKWLDKWPTFGIHASLLPQYAGGAPLVWAMIEGRRRVGVTLFQIDKGIDNGPIVAQERIRVSRRDDISTLLRKVEAVSVTLSVDEIPKILSPLSPRKLQRASRREVYPQRKPEDGLITDSMGITEIRNFVRAQTRPYPGAFVMDEEDRLVIWNVGRTSFSWKTRRSLFERSGNLYLGRGHLAIKLTSVSRVNN